MPYKIVPNSFGRVYNLNLLLDNVRLAMRTLGWSEPTIWVNNHTIRPMLNQLERKKLIYDVTDDWNQCTMSQRQSRMVRDDDTWLTKNADDVIVCSPGLLQLKRDMRRTVHLVRNGVDSEFFSPQRLALLSRPPQLDSVTGPIAGYTGTLHEDRLDIPLIADLCRNYPHINFVFVGPNCLGADSQRMLAAFPNCYFIGRQPYDDVPRFVAAFDVCITPHRVTAFTESLDPIKLYEYLSTGKPIVATPCAGFRDVADLVCIAADARSFGAAIEGGLESHPAKQAQLRWASDNNWFARVKEVESILGWDAAMEPLRDGQVISAASAVPRRAEAF